MRNSKIGVRLAAWIFFFAFGVIPLAQEKQTEPATLDSLQNRIQTLEQIVRNQAHSLSELSKAIDDLAWYQKVGDMAQVDKVTYTGLPGKKTRKASGSDKENELVVYAYTFIPKKLDHSKKNPLLVFPHGGVHSSFDTFYHHIVRELIEQGYVIVAPDYRGSSGYGRNYYESIDYGGLEVEDVFRARSWMLESYDFLDPKRVGILGWSHGGLITLLNLFEHPEAYAVGYAGNPVSDLVARMGYKSQSYQGLFSTGYHIGKTASENVREYQRRSPAWNAAKLKTPLLIHTTTNDSDVDVLEVRSLITALKAEGKDFQYKIYDEAPGEHRFNRIDTKLARESRTEVYKFLARYLKPGQ